MNSFFIAATNKMSWGRGSKLWEAVGHAIEHGGAGVTECVVFEIWMPEGGKESDIHVNETGGIVAPSGSKVVERATIKDDDGSLSGFWDYRDALMGWLGDAEL